MHPFVLVTVDQDQKFGQWKKASIPQRQLFELPLNDTCKATRRPPIPRDVRALISRMSRENPLWGAPRIHGELLKLGIEVSEATVPGRRRHRQAGHRHSLPRRRGRARAFSSASVRV